VALVVDPLMNDLSCAHQPRQTWSLPFSL